MGKKKNPRRAAGTAKAARERGPLLSVAIIFKNEVRCLERCLRSFDQLRREIPMEIVMADTGSDDGSREIAARYADVLFDFPWINDFAAARNAVIDRCSGVWVLHVDCDEWLDGDTAELKDVVSIPGLRGKYKAGVIHMYNYTDENLREYGEFKVARLMLRGAGVRYEAPIHEFLTGFKIDEELSLENTILHHDGYVALSTTGDAKKRERNMALLRKELEKAPEDLKLIMQCIESSVESEKLEYARRGVELVRKKTENWNILGAVIFRDAVQSAAVYGAPEMQAWAGEARELFPDSFYVRVDIPHILFSTLMSKKKYEDAIPDGEEYLRQLRRYRETGEDHSELMAGGLSFSSPHREQMGRCQLAWAYHETGRETEAAETLAQLDLSVLGANEWDRALELTDTLQARGADVSAVRTAFLDQFARLAGKEGDTGRLAAMLAGGEPEELSRLAAGVEDWRKASAYALASALTGGAQFPPEGSRLYFEDLVALARRLPKKALVELACAPASGETPRDVCWAGLIAMSAARNFDWERDSEADGVRLARSVAGKERAFLPVCYSRDALSEEGLFMLPGLHRFGWWCVRAFDALDAGDELGFVRALRSGLEMDAEMKGMVKFLTGRIELLRPVSAELLELAEKVRAILARFSPDDPAVVQLKASPMYQKVARLIETGGSAPVRERES